MVAFLVAAYDLDISPPKRREINFIHVTAIYIRHALGQLQMESYPSHEKDVFFCVCFFLL